MTREEAIAELRECQRNNDIEQAHARADETICSFLLSLGYHDVVDEYVRVDKWYA